MMMVARARQQASVPSPAEVTPPDKRRSESADALVERIKETLGAEWMGRIYREGILKMRTRSHHLQTGQRNARVEVQHTLLGIELKIGKHRMLCPDLATARYLAAFARLGCADVAVPYDISRISAIADELESAWHRMLLLADHLATERSAAFRARLRSHLVAAARREITEAGAGTAIPQFVQNTKQRPART